MELHSSAVGRNILAHVLRRPLTHTVLEWDLAVCSLFEMMILLLFE